jgi:hypothetical protein
LNSALVCLFALRKAAFAALMPAREIGKTGAFHFLFNRFSDYFARLVRRFCVRVEARRHAC